MSDLKIVHDAAVFLAFGVPARHGDRSMSDIVEELRRASARGMEHHAGPVRAYLDAEMLAEAAAEIERLRAYEEMADWNNVDAGDLHARNNRVMAARLKAAEAQRDALVVACEPFVSERLRWPDYVPDGDHLFIASPDDIEPILDEYAALCGSKSAGVSFSNDTVTVGHLRALAAAVAGAGAKTEGE